MHRPITPDNSLVSQIGPGQRMGIGDRPDLQAVAATLRFAYEIAPTPIPRKG